mgnify:CR=1 FL=1
MGGNGPVPYENVYARGLFTKLPRVNSGASSIYEGGDVSIFNQRSKSVEPNLIYPTRMEPFRVPKYFT